MPLEKKLFPLPLTDGPDAGKDPKLVSGLIVADNVSWTRQGAAEKRFCGMWENDADEYGFMLAPVDDRWPLKIGDNMRKYDDSTYQWTTMDKAGLSDVGVYDLLSTMDGYYWNFQYSRMGTEYYALSYTSHEFYLTGYTDRLIMRVFSAKTGKEASSWAWGITETALKNHMLRPVVLANNDVNFYFIDDTDSNLYYVKAYVADGSNSGLFPIAATGIEPAIGYSKVDACLGYDDNTVFITYTGTPGTGAGRPVLVCHNITYEMFSTSELYTATEAWHVGVWPYHDTGNDEYGCMVAWYEMTELALYCLTCSISADVVRSNDGAGAPLSVCEFGSDVCGTIITGINTSEYLGGDDRNRVFVSTREYPSGLETEGIAAGQNEECLYAFDIQSDDLDKISVVYTPLPVMPGCSKGQMVSKPWIDDAGQLLFIATAARNTYTLRDTDGDIIGRAMFETAALDGYMEQHLATGFVAEPMATGYYYGGIPDGYTMDVGVIKKEGDLWTLSKLRCLTDIKTIMSTQEPMQQCSAVDTIFIPNSHPYEWDGRNLTEAGFIDTPRYVDLSADTGGSMAVGRYAYQVLYSWGDAHGALHRSCPSDPFFITLTAGQTAVDVVVPAERSTRKSNVRIELYRTTANGNEPKLIHFWNNDEWLAFGQLTWTDTLDDSYLEDAAPIYVTGGIKEDVAPPPYWVHCVHQSRHFVVDRENDTTHIYYSKQLVPGYGIEHNDAFLIKVPPQGGRINALVSMLDRLAILKQDAVYVVSGSGPDALGQQGSYSEPYAISLNCGCSNRRTVVEVPEGVMFRSRQGIMQLGKSLQLSYIGEPVRYWTDNAVITGAVGRKDKSCVLWFCSSQWASGRTNEPYVLVYNYKHEKWSSWSGSMLRAESVTVCTDDRIWLTFGGIVAFSADNYLYDISYSPGLTEHPINMSLETGWISFAGVGGFARVYKVFFVGQQIDTTGEHTLHMSVAYDYDGYNEYDLEFDKTNIASFDFSTYYGDMDTQANDGYGCVLEAVLPRQKCSALKLHMYDDEATTGSKSWSATAFGFLVGIKPQGDQGVVGKVFTKTG